MGAIKPSPTDRRDAGFTLTELLVVLALIGLLTLSAPALISAARPTVTAKTTAFALAGELRTLRQAAIATGREMQAVFYRDAARYGVRMDGRAYVLPGVSLAFAPNDAASTDADAMIRFFPDGSSSGGRIRLQAERSSIAISVHWLSGKVTVDE